MDKLAYKIVRYLRQHGESPVIDITRKVFGKHSVTKANDWSFGLGIYYKLLEMNELVTNINAMPDASLKEQVESSRWKLKE